MHIMYVYDYDIRHSHLGFFCSCCATFWGRNSTDRAIISLLRLWHGFPCVASGVIVIGWGFFSLWGAGVVIICLFCTVVQHESLGLMGNGDGAWTLRPRLSIHLHWHPRTLQYQLPQRSKRIIMFSSFCLLLDSIGVYDTEWKLLTVLVSTGTEQAEQVFSINSYGCWATCLCGGLWDWQRTRESI